MRRSFAVLVVLALAVATLVAGSSGSLAGAASGAAPAAAAGAPPAPAAAAKRGRVSMRVRAPRGVPVTVLLKGRSARSIATDGTRPAVRRTVGVSAGRHRVVAPMVVHDDQVYVGRASRRVVRVPAGGTSKVAVRYTRVTAAPTGLSLTDLQPDSVALTWTSGVPVQLRRTAGTVPATSVRDGVAVPTTDGSATDDGVEPATAYAYALFGRVGGRWVGPLTEAVSTPGDAGPDEPSTTYVAADDTVTLPPQAVESATAASGSLLVELGSPQTIDSVLVLPPSAALPDGFLGRVTDVRPDGVLELAPASLGDAFVYLDIDVPQIQSDPIPGEVVEGAARFAPMPRDSDTAGRAAAVPSCLKLSNGNTFGMQPTFQPHGSFHGTILWKELPWLPDVPKGAHIQGNLGIKLGGAAYAKVKLALSCGLQFQKISTQVTAIPVPLNLTFEPVVSAYTSGAVEVSNIGAEADAGFWFDTQFGAADNYADGGVQMEAHALTPQAKLVGSVGFKLEGRLIFGPGAAGGPAGAIAGVRGTMTALDASASVLRVQSEDDPDSDTCVKLDLGWGLNADVVASFWIPRYAKEVAVDIPGLKTTGSYGGPYYFRRNCDKPGANDIYLVDVESEGNDAGVIGGYLTDQGFHVETGTAMPDNPDDFNQIWAFGTYSGYPADLREGLKDYVLRGGSVFMNSEHSCCDATNRDVESFLNSVLRDPVGVVTACTEPCVGQSDPLNPDAIGGIADSPHAGASVFTDALGYYTGVPAANQMLVAHGYVGGTVWQGSDMKLDQGRVVTIADSNWSDDSRFPGENEQFVDNVVAYLAGG